MPSLCLCSTRLGSVIEFPGCEPVTLPLSGASSKKHSGAAVEREAVVSSKPKSGKLLSRIEASWMLGVGCWTQLVANYNNNNIHPFNVHRCTHRQSVKRSLRQKPCSAMAATLCTGALEQARVTAPAPESKNKSNE